MQKDSIIENINANSIDREEIAKKITEAKSCLSNLSISPEKRLAIKEKENIQIQLNALVNIFEVTKNPALTVELNQKAIDILVKIMQLQKKLPQATTVSPNAFCGTLFRASQNRSKNNLEEEFNKENNFKK